MKHHGGMWDPKKKGKSKQKLQKQRCQNYSKSGKIPGSIVSVPRVYYCAMDDLQIIKLLD